MANPVANPDDEDFEPDGTWYSMTATDGALYPMDSNHGELDRVTTSGQISRVVDISAKVGHVVPTAIIPGGPLSHQSRGWAHNHKGQPSFFIANLGVFGDEDGTTPDETVWKLHGTHLRVRTTGLEQVLGLARTKRGLFALESS